MAYKMAAAAASATAATKQTNRKQQQRGGAGVVPVAASRQTSAYACLGLCALLLTHFRPGRARSGRIKIPHTRLARAFLARPK